MQGLSSRTSFHYGMCVWNGRGTAMRAHDDWPRGDAIWRSHCDLNPQTKARKSEFRRFDTLLGLFSWLLPLSLFKPKKRGHIWLSEARKYIYINISYVLVACLQRNLLSPLVANWFRPSHGTYAQIRLGFNTLLTQSDVGATRNNEDYVLRSGPCSIP